MVDSRSKGARGEQAVKKLLVDATGLPFERTPQSGALAAAHKLKGDVYVPGKTNVFTIEVKNYAEDPLSSKHLKNKTCLLDEWWEQAKREAKQNDNLPLLFYKYYRSPWFVVVGSLTFLPEEISCIYSYRLEAFILPAEDFLKFNKQSFIT